MKNKKGFTLIEIIIVIIIIGVLAALALPKLTKKVSESKSAQILTTIGAYARALDGCYQLAQAAADCQDYGAAGIGIADPNAGAFSYTAPSAFPVGHVLVGTCAAVAGGCAAASTITAAVVCAVGDGCTINSANSWVKTGDFSNLKLR